MRIVLPLACAPDPRDLDAWSSRAAVEGGPGPADHRDAFERVVGLEPPGPPVDDGPLRRAGASILTYRIFPTWLLTPVLRRAPLMIGDTVGAFYHPLGRWLGGVFFASRVVAVFDEARDGRWRVGFTYRTLERHPERGEETFSAEKDLVTGHVLVALRSWSSPGHALSRALEPVGRVLQVRANDAALANLACVAQGDAGQVVRRPSRRRRW
jgi:uncharacterized protein (UPF0548 family)